MFCICSHDRSWDECSSWYLFKLRAWNSSKNIKLKSETFQPAVIQTFPTASSAHQPLCAGTRTGACLSVKIKTVGRCPSASTSTLFPQIYLKPLDRGRGCLVAPARRPGVQRVGCLLFLCNVNTVGCDLALHLTGSKEMTIWGQMGSFIVFGFRREGTESTGTLQSVSGGLPLIVRMDRLITDPQSFEKYTVGF